MNAYELADELAFKHIAGDESGAFNSKLIVMLRQQADRIAELEGEVSHLKHINKNWSISEGCALQRIAELEKQSEALADEYALQVNEVCRLSYEIEKLESQTKPLSNEEIRQLAERYLAGFSEYNCCNTHVEGEIEFARAIEAKVRGQ